MNFDLAPIFNGLGTPIKIRKSEVRICIKLELNNGKRQKKLSYLPQYSAPRLNGQCLSCHFLAVKAGWPIIRANLM